MASKLAVRGFVVGSCLLAFLSSACTPSAPPTPTPSTSTSTPTETAQEREEREAYAAAETSYREFRAEFNRVLMVGGARKATGRMSDTASGSYLKENLEVVEAYRALGYRQKGSDTIEYVRSMGYSPNSVLLTSCENATGARAVTKEGNIVGVGDVRTLELEVRKTQGSWKVWSGSGKQVSTCGG